MAQTAFWIYELEFQVDTPSQTSIGEPMTIYGVNNRIAILDGVSAAADAANSTREDGLQYGGIAVRTAGTDATVAVTAYVYTNEAQTAFDQLVLQRPSVATTTMSLVPAAGASYLLATFKHGPIVAPYGLRVAMEHGSATAGTVTVDLIVQEK